MVAVCRLQAVCCIGPGSSGVTPKRAVASASSDGQFSSAEYEVAPGGVHLKLGGCIEKCRKFSVLCNRGLFE